MIIDEICDILSHYNPNECSIKAVYFEHFVINVLGECAMLYI